MSVFVLDKRKQPLMPCSEKRARLLLRKGRAVVHRLVPFTIRLKERTRAESAVQVTVLKVDPGSKTTGLALARGELFGWEIRSYVLEKFGRRCAYCHISNVPFEIDHQIPVSRGGSNRVNNLVLSCHTCNLAKGDKTAAEWGHREVEYQARTPLRDAAAVNTTRYALVEALLTLGLPIGCWSGGYTRWNRDRFGIQKSHCLDALCVGELAGVQVPALRTLVITAQGRGVYRRTNVDASGFPRGYYTREKRIRSFSTGDLVRAEVPGRLKTAGEHLGRVAVRASGSFRVGKTDGINARYCRVVQRLDGYDYVFD